MSRDSVVQRAANALREAGVTREERLLVPGARIVEMACIQDDGLLKV